MAQLQLQSFVAVFFALLGFAYCGPCQDDTWRYSPHSNRCFKLFNEKIGWTLAEFKCAFKGGHHLSVHNPADNQFLAELAKQADLVWLGIAQFGTSQNYVWSDLTGYDYENWHAKHNYRKPVYNKGRKCAKLEGSSATWVQSCCKVPAAYICGKNARAGYVEPAAAPTTVAPTTTTTQSSTPPTTPWWLNPSFTTTVNNNDLRRFRFRRLRL